jgi:ubiquinone/menaquinone biosynthesis C-methylase UbiE
MSQSLSFDRVANQYDSTRGYSPEVAATIAEAMARAGGLVTGSEALEIGIGTGRIALPLLARGTNVTGVDIAPRMLDQLDQKYAQLRTQGQGTSYGRLVVRIADMAMLPFKDASFDAVIAVHVFHLVAEWRRALDEALRVMRLDGALLIGQDVNRGSETAHHDEIQDHWQQILREMGYTHINVGARGYDAVLDELEARGLQVQEQPIIEWETSATPRQALESITERIWSRTWNVPDDLFAESARRLNEWATQTYGSRLNTPAALPHAFRLARVCR